jgi:PEP-CTERM motif
MKRFVPALAVAVVATLGMGSAAKAALIDFSAVALCPTTCTGITYTGTTLGASTAFDLDGSSWLVDLVAPGDKSGLAAGGTFAVMPTSVTYGSGGGPITLTVPIFKTWTATVGPYAGDMFTEKLTTLTSISRGSNTISFDFAGTITGGGFTLAPATMDLGLTQAGGPGNVVSASLTNHSVGVVPEPATWVMLTLGFVGLGYAAVRRSAKDRTTLAI